MLSAILPWNGVRKLSVFARIHAEPVMRTQELCRGCSNPWRLSSDRSRMTGKPEVTLLQKVCPVIGLSEINYQSWMNISSQEANGAHIR